MKKKKTKLSQSFQRWLIVLVAIAFLATTAFLWLIQTRLSENNAISLLNLNLSDVREDINDASDENLLRISRHIAADMNELNGTQSGSVLDALAEEYDVTEINVIDAKGIITATTHPAFLDYNMASGSQSAEFMVLLEGQAFLDAWEKGKGLALHVRGEEISGRRFFLPE